MLTLSLLHLIVVQILHPLLLSSDGGRNTITDLVLRINQDLLGRLVLVTDHLLFLVVLVLLFINTSLPDLLELTVTIPCFLEFFL